MTDWRSEWLTENASNVNKETLFVIQRSRNLFSFIKHLQLTTINITYLLSIVRLDDKWTYKKHVQVRVGVHFDYIFSMPTPKSVGS